MKTETILLAAVGAYAAYYALHRVAATSAKKDPNTPKPTDSSITGNQAGDQLLTNGATHLFDWLFSGSGNAASTNSTGGSSTNSADGNNSDLWSWIA